MISTIIPNKSNLLHSDLVEGVYEGGLKVWECSIDLLNYLAEMAATTDYSQLKVLSRYQIQVFEIGCGHGLPGIFCLLRGSQVLLQDFNEEVIAKVTKPTVELNASSTSHQSNCKFMHGDWDNLDLADSKFELVLTSETIYNTKNYEKLHNLLQRSLSSNGIVLIAAKR